MRRLAGASVLGVLAVLVVFGALVASALDGIFARQYNAPTWTPASNEPSGIAYVGGGQFLVVDTNLNNAGTNGWLLTAAPQPPGTVSNVGSGVAEPTGVDYHAASDTLFVSSDASDGFIEIFEGWTPGDTTPNHTVDTFAVAQSFDPLVEAADTEDPAFDGRYLYWASGSDQFIYWRDTGDGTFDVTDTYGRAPITMEQPDDPLDPEAEFPDWEAMTWDAESSRLLLASRHSLTLYHVTVDTGGGTINVDVETDDLDISDSEGDLGDIAGMTIGPASYDNTKTNLFVTSRFSHTVIELTVDNSVAPNTTTTSSSSSSSSSSSTSSTPTTQATTTTTTPGPTTSTTTPGGGPAGFDDTVGHTHATAISWLADQGITEGCNPPDNDLFCPDDNVSRGQMAAFLVRAFKYSDDGGGGFFDDTAGNIFETAIDRLRVAGITEGCNPPDNDEYCPSGFVTRGQMAAFLVRAFGYSDSGAGNYFVDTEGVFETAINRLRVAGVTQGCNPPDNDRFCPDDLVTRGQMATFLKRGFDNQ